MAGGSWRARVPTSAAVESATAGPVASALFDWRVRDMDGSEPVADGREWPLTGSRV